MKAFRMTGFGDATYSQSCTVMAASKEDALQRFRNGEGVYEEGSEEVSYEDFEWDSDSLEECE